MDLLKFIYVIHSADKSRFDLYFANEAYTMLPACTNNLGFIK